MKTLVVDSTNGILAESQKNGKWVANYDTAESNKSSGCPMCDLEAKQRECAELMKHYGISKPTPGARLLPEGAVFKMRVDNDGAVSAAVPVNHIKISNDSYLEVPAKVSKFGATSPMVILHDVVRKNTKCDAILPLTPAWTFRSHTPTAPSKTGDALIYGEFFKSIRAMVRELCLDNATLELVEADLPFQAYQDVLDALKAGRAVDEIEVEIWKPWMQRFGFNS